MTKSVWGAARTPLPAAQSAKAPPSAPRRRLEGLSILVVEDNPISQMVLEDILEAEGAQVSIVSDGQQAIDAIRQHGPSAYHLVLMDLQMPLMDGYEAARQLHVLAPNLPIIGQSANTLSDDRTQCFTAYIVAYMTKPLDRAALLHCILQHTRPNAVIKAERHQPSSPALTTRDEDGIQWQELGNRYADHPIFINRLLNVFLNSNANLSNQLRQTLQQQDHHTLSGLAHGLKGMASSIAAHRLAILSQITALAAKQRMPDLIQRTEALVQCLEHTLADIRQRLRQPPSY